MKKTFAPKEKADIALEAIRGDKTFSEIAGSYEVHPKQISRWKKDLETGAPALFADKRKKKIELEHQQTIDELHRVIGQRDIELEWLKKKLHIPSKS